MGFIKVNRSMEFIAVKCESERFGHSIVRINAMDTFDICHLKKDLRQVAGLAYALNV